MDCQQSLNAQHSLKTLSEMSETQWPHTFYLSLNLGKLNILISHTGASGLGCNGYISNSGCFGSKTECSNFYWLVSNS
jgi:hypothetical protein